MKKILLLVTALIAVVATLSVGTFAYFSDTETSNANLITAGTIDLKINNTDSDYQILSAGVSNVKPGDSQSDKYAPLKFVGTVTTNQLIVTTVDITNAPGTTTDAESDVNLGNDSSDDGELGSLLKITLWLDLGTAGWDAGDKYMLANGTWGTVAAEAGPTDVAALASTFSERTWAALTTDWANNTTKNFYFYWEFPEGGVTDNKAQGDTLNFDFKFEMKQR